MSAGGQIVAIAIGLCGLAGVIFTALRFNRDDTTSIVQQQTALLGNMQALYDTEHTELAAVTSERDALRAEVARLRASGA
jgi:hypothetical protein